MKLAAAVTAALSLVPAAALACPGAASACGSCGGSNLGPYLAALGIGLLVGMGSIRLQGLFRRK
jgi:hypothetical protein